MKWSIEIQKTSLEKRNLADLLRGLEFELVEGIEYPALASQIIDACVTAADAFEIAKRVRTAFKGPAQIDPEFVLGSVIDYSTNPPRRHAFLEADSCVMTTTISTATVTVSPPSGLSPAELESWNADCDERQYQARLERQRSRLEPAYRCPRAAQLIELLSIEKPSAETVYKIYELAEGHPKKTEPISISSSGYLGSNLIVSETRYTIHRFMGIGHGTHTLVSRGLLIP